ncbi:MAG: aminoacyl-tRNA hydrolase [Clostridia bacterium]|nr:aminoacyl-tRNA hydrolase [Clostridia bacterium]
MEKFLVVGLGNPGLRFKHTRHNMGFMVVDFLSQKYNIKVNKTNGKAVIGEGIIEGVNVILAKPQTYMNNSGESVRELVSYHQIQLSNLIVIYDDMDIDLGKIRIRKKGSSGTHNGMRSIMYHLKNEEFPRIRVGIGEKKEADAKNHVLSKIRKEEREVAFESIKNSAESAVYIIQGQIDTAMNRFNP